MKILACAVPVSRPEDAVTKLLSPKHAALYLATVARIYQDSARYSLGLDGEALIETQDITVCCRPENAYLYILSLTPEVSVN